MKSLGVNGTRQCSKKEKVRKKGNRDMIYEARQPLWRRRAKRASENRSTSQNHNNRIQTSRTIASGMRKSLFAT